MPSIPHKATPILAGACIVLVLALGYVLYDGHTRAHELAEDILTLSSSTDTLTLELERKEQDIETLLQENGNLQHELALERGKNKVFEDRIRDIGETVGVLDKLAATDEELLQKYSRVYFLNEHYVPPSLTAIKEEFKFNPQKELEIHTQVEPQLHAMLEEAREKDHELLVLSAYRSFGTQAALKSQYTVLYGSGANQFSADQGYSEHQLGTTVDLTVPSVGATFTGFENTDAYTWLRDNAYKYGFVLSYPENNTYYEFEPWHWRFVGVELARYLHNEDVNFYDADQRVINNYLVTIFD